MSCVAHCCSTVLAGITAVSLGAQPKSVSVQGLLAEAGVPVNRAVTLRIALIDDADPNIGSKVDLDGDGTTQGTDEDVVVRSVVVTDGLFETDFGPIEPAAFDGTPRFLRIQVDAAPVSDSLVVPFFAEPRVSEVVVSPDGRQSLVLTSNTGGIAVGGADPAARLDVRPSAPQTGVGVIQTFTDEGDGSATIVLDLDTDNDGIDDLAPSVYPGDLLISTRGGARVLIGLVTSTVGGTVTAQYAAPSQPGAPVPLPGDSYEVRQPALRIGANPSPEGYPDGLPRSGLIVTDDGRVGINTVDTPPDADLAVGQGGADVRGLLSVSELVVGPMGAVVDGEIRAAALSGAFVETLSSGYNTTQGLIQLGDVLLQWGRFTTPSSGELTITLARPYLSTFEMHGFVQADRVTDFSNTEYTNLNVQQFEIYSQENSTGPVGSTSGHWLVIGRTP